jgi:hypothetical protein
MDGQTLAEFQAEVLKQEQNSQRHRRAQHDFEDDEDLDNLLDPYAKAERQIKRLMEREAKLRRTGMSEAAIHEVLHGKRIVEPQKHLKLDWLGEWTCVLVTVAIVLGIAYALTKFVKWASFN